MNKAFELQNAWYGLEVLDSQHRDILELHDSIKSKAESGEYDEHFINKMWDLHEVLLDHFVHEEYALKKLPENKYGAYIDHHIKVHDHILNTIEQVAGIISSKDDNAVISFIPDIVYMLLDSMMSDDNRLIGYLEEEGIKLQPSDIYQFE
jgi:hemerythrin